MKVLIDNGHGSNTSGKHSPDKRFYEWKWAREIAIRLEAALKLRGIDVERIVTEDKDILLRERVNRVNKICNKVGYQNVVLVSIHSNAEGKDGKWHDSNGFCVFVSKKCSENSKKFAQLIYDAAYNRNLKGDRWVPKERYWQANYTIITETACPAILTENMFQDNKKDVDFLLSEEGKQIIVDLHVEGILKYIQMNLK